MENIHLRVAEKRPASGLLGEYYSYVLVGVREKLNVRTKKS